MQFENSNPLSDTDTDVVTSENKNAEVEQESVTGSNGNGHHNPPGKSTAATAPGPNPTDPLTVALEEDTPTLETPSAARLSGYETEEEVRAWALALAYLNSTYVKWMGCGASTVAGLVPKEARLETQTGRINSQIKAEPDTIGLSVFDPRYHEKFSVLTKPAKNFVLTCWATCIAVICSVLIAESGFEVTAAMESQHGFLQNGWGAFSMVFSVSFGSFVVLTLWLAAEKSNNWNWALKMVARIGAVGSVSLVTVLGIVLGKPEDELFAWPMVLIPLCAVVLICSAIGAKEAFMSVCTKAIPVRNVKNKKVDKLWVESASLDDPIEEVKDRKAKGEQLIKRASSFAEEFAGRVVEAWRRVKRWEESEAAAQEASKRKMLAAVEEELAANAFKNLTRPD